jgi:hypothetical protein
MAKKNGRPHSKWLGTVHGTWTVKQKAGKNKFDAVQWLCECQCGNAQVFISSKIKTSLPACKQCTLPRNVIDLSGQAFGKWLVLSFSRIRKTHKNNTVVSGLALWNCQCECGTVREVSGSHLRKGTSTSCGCFKPRNPKLLRRGKWLNGAISPEYRAWRAMKYRCLNPNCHAYKNYGGRGISVCHEWLGKHGFDNFLQNMGRKPRHDLSLDRINNNGNYEPSNCRWATRLQQSRNRRTVKATKHASPNI